MSPEGIERRGQHPAKRVMMFFLALVVDKWQGLSLTRFIAVTLTIASVHGPFVHERPITAMDVTMATLATVAALGGKYVLAFLERVPKVP